MRALHVPGAAEVGQLLLADAGYVVAVCAAGSRLHLFTPNGLPVWSWSSQGAGISASALSPCGAALLCGFDDGTLVAWRLHDRQPLGAFLPAPAPVVCLATTRDAFFVGTSRDDLLCYAAPHRWEAPAPAPSQRHSQQRPQWPQAQQQVDIS